MSATRRLDEGRAPSGWVRRSPNADGVQFCHRGTGVRLEATESGVDVPAGRTGGRKWVVRGRGRVGESGPTDAAAGAETLARAATKRRAVRRLYDWMERLDDAMDEENDVPSVRRLVERVDGDRPVDASGGLRSE